MEIENVITTAGEAATLLANAAEIATQKQALIDRLLVEIADRQAALTALGYRKPRNRAVKPAKRPVGRPKGSRAKAAAEGPAEATA